MHRLLLNRSTYGHVMLLWQSAAASPAHTIYARRIMCVFCSKCGVHDVEQAVNGRCEGRGESSCTHTQARVHWYTPIVFAQCSLSDG